jgi:cytochrome b involved in lipid metabolism
MVKHPGGAAVFTNKLGSDLTERFFFVHTAFGFTHLEKLAVAAVVDARDVAADEK